MSHKKRKLDDESYFKSYADITIHEDMIDDYIRTSAYRRAILSNYKDFYGKVVMDVGAGTGILSMFCVQAGAKKVYAVEASELATETSKVVALNNMSDRIAIIHSPVEEADIPEKVDVVVSEWMGYFLLYETMLPSVLFARDKWLKQGGLLFPSRATLYLAPVSDLHDLQQRQAFWDEAGARYKLDLSSFRPYSRACLCRWVHVVTIEPSQVMARPAVICSLDLNNITTQDLHTIQSDFEFSAFGCSSIEGFVSWFTVDFPGDVSLTTSPYKEPTHWCQSLLYLNKSFHVTQDSIISGTISLSPNQSYNRFLDITLRYAVEGVSSQQVFHMDDHTS